jgi:hypothetical protein
MQGSVVAQERDDAQRIVESPLGSVSRRSMRSRTYVIDVQDIR